MEISVLFFLAIMVLAFSLFAREVYPLEISALLIMVLLVFSGILTANQAFESFGNSSIVLIGSLFILIAGLRKTGIIMRLEEILLRFGGTSRNFSFVAMMLLVAFVSAFVSNTATLAVAIPIIVSMARKFGDSPKLWLMPIAFASVLGGMNSLIGTSTNIIISSLLEGPEYQQLGLQSFSLFTTARAGVWILLVGLLYLLLVSRYLLPQEEEKASQSIDVKYDIRSYTAEIILLDDSPLCDLSIEKCPLFREADITVLSIERKGQDPLIPRAQFILSAGDRMVVEGNIKKLTAITDKYGLKFEEELKSDENAASESTDERELEFYEVLVSPGSLLNNRTPAGVFLRNRYRISLIAINRYGRTIHEKLSNVRISSGDILVVQFLGTVDNNLLDYLGLVPLQKLQQERYKTAKAPLAGAIFILALLVGSISDWPIALTCLFGAVLLVVLKILRIEEVYESLEWRVLIFIGAVLCLGRGMSESGTAAFLAEHISEYFATFDPLYARSFFFVLTVIMTTLLSNQATAVVMVPLAVSTAQELGLPFMPFVMSVTLAASCCFATPFEPAFMLVYGPGGYKFSDFFRVGILLNIVIIFVAVWLIPRVY